MEQLLDNRSTLVAASGDREFVPVAENLEEEYKEQALSPIICAGDVLGAVIITTKDGKIHFTDTEKHWLLQQLIFRKTDGILIVEFKGV